MLARGTPRGADRASEGEAALPMGNLHDFMANWSLSRSILIGLCFVVLIDFAFSPILTNDGAVHVSMSNLLNALSSPDHELENKIYRLNVQINPNLITYLLISGLLLVVSPPVAESLIQALCILLPVAAGYFALSTINPRNAWLAIFILPLSLNRMFFLGLYSHCISIAVFFLAIGIYFRLQRKMSSLLMLLLGATLTLAFFCHASGFIMSVCGLGTMTAIKIWAGRQQGFSWLRAVGRQHRSLVALTMPLPFLIFFLVFGEGGPIDYGISPIDRLKEFVTLGQLQANSQYDYIAALALATVLWGGSAWCVWRLVRNRLKLSEEHRGNWIAAFGAFATCVLVVMIFPDSFGGGWTHFRRFAIFPFFWLLIIIAFAELPRVMRAGMLACATAVAIVLIASMVFRQAMIRDQMRPMADVDRLVGEHCTVLPLVFATRPVDQHGAPLRMTYDPFFQAASQLEMRADRVVLFNYLVRLGVYPVRYHSNADPQKYLFKLEDKQRRHSLSTIDVAGFQKTSGVAVDFVLIWGKLEDQQPAQIDAVNAAISGASLIYTSPDKGLKLFQRPRQAESLCVI